MSVAVGTRIGPYDVLSLLGTGGMGEVYRARDRQLQREVALKLLPDGFASDPDRLARFEREAQTLALLNHPNIAQVYGLEGTGPTRCIVMELVDGETLQDRLRRGPIPVDEALPMAMQIGDALEAAHGRGIVHRDLKPANIKVTSTGKVKVLDFGLSKAIDPDAAPDLSHSPTVLSGTVAGVIVGTAAYMSPEQAKGKRADARSDIWSFGVVLYEMLAGKPAFDGETLLEILGGVMKSEPDWAALPSSTPPTMRALLRRCLQKDRDRRFRDIADVKIQIEDALNEPKPIATVGATPNRRGNLGWAAAGVLFMAAAGLSMPAIRYFREPPPPDLPETRTEIVTPETTDALSFAISPDGSQLVFAASADGPTRLWIRRLASETAQPLPGTEGAVYPFWSPDSKSIGYFAGTKLLLLDIAGGSPQVVATIGQGRGGSWSRDGTILFAGGITQPLTRVPASGGVTTAVTELSGFISHRFPQFLPDGRRFLFFAQGSPDVQGIYLGSLDSTSLSLVTKSDNAGLYAAGWLFWLRDGTLVARRFDLAQAQLSGEDAVPVADQVSFGLNHGAFSISAAGMVVYRSGGAQRRQLRWFNRAGEQVGVLGDPTDDADFGQPSLAPDDKRVAVVRTVQGNADIWILDGARASRFTFDPAREQVPAWSSDGSRIVFDSNRKGHRDLYVKASNGGTREQVLLESAEEKVATGWSRDGSLLLYHTQPDRNVWVLPLVGGRQPWVFLKTSFNERQGELSPDGRWMAYMSNESGRTEIYVRPFVLPADGDAARKSGNDTSGQWQVSTEGGLYPRWRADGGELYYIGPDAEIRAAAFKVSGNTPEIAAPIKLFDTRIVGGGADANQNRQYDVSRDGRFLINSIVEESAAPITILQNWKPAR